MTMLIFTGLLAIISIILLSSRVNGGARSSLFVSMFLAVVLLAARHHLGLRLDLHDDDDPDYLAVCDFIRDHTPVDAIFVVPPNEQVFRYRAQRAIVVNFKNVPQLSGQMGEWKSRLETVLGEPLSNLPRRFDLAHAAIAARYDSRTPAQLAAVAQQYGATFIVTARPFPNHQTLFEKGVYHLYASSNLANTPDRLKEGSQMDSAQLQEKLRAILGWRVGEETAAYILSRLAADAGQVSFPILANDARTGHAIRPMLHPHQLSAGSEQPAPAANNQQFLLFPL
jgi:hypothetical protein